MNIVLKDNIEVSIRELHQWGTYNGLLEGLPTDASNKRTIETVIKRAQEMSFLNNYYLIEPEQTPIKINRPYRFGTPMSLPSTVCIAELWHHQPARNEDMHASSLLVIWFQETYCFPIEDDILEKFKTIDWGKHAYDFEY